jgi:hypothetical protein
VVSVFDDIADARCAPDDEALRTFATSILALMYGRGATTRGASIMAMSEAQCTLRASLRKLWADHVIWTRQYIVAFASDGADTGAAAGRLLKNQEHIGNAIVPFYGQAAGAQLTDLLKQHILIAVDLLTAAKAGDDAEFQRQDQRWSQNVEEIAALLSGANPNWPKNDVVDLLGVHLKLTKDEAVARLTGKWDDDVVAFDDIFTEIMTVSDTLADGIVKQFPERFVTLAIPGPATVAAVPQRRGLARVFGRGR